MSLKEISDFPKCSNCNGTGYTPTEWTDDCSCIEGCEECGDLCTACNGEGIEIEDIDLIDEDDFSEFDHWE